MLIMLEGADGAGKTTLAQELAAYLGRTTSDKVEIWHAGRPKRHPLDEYLHPLTSYRPGTGHHVILDRWHWGEFVYPAVLERETQLDQAVWWSIEAYMRRLGALAVVCDRNATFEYAQVFRERDITEDGPDGWQIRHLSRIRLEFTRLSYRSQLPSWTHNVGDNIVSEIVAAARRFEEAHRPLNDFVTYLGPARPRALLVGDVRNIVPKLDPTNASPAFLPTASSSGHYLLKSLTAQPSRDWRQSLGLANARDVDDVVKLHETLGRPWVVALGKNAYGKLLTHGIKCNVVPHPQYVRRFHHKLHHEYGWAIARATRSEEDLSKWPQSSAETTDAPSTPTSSPRSGSLEPSVPVATE